MTSAPNQPVADVVRTSEIDQDPPRRPWPLRALYAFGRWWETPAAFDVTVCMVFVSFSFFLFRGLWPDPAVRAIADNANDQALIEWFLGHGVLVWTGDFSFVTDRLNSPDGVNLMSNASHILHGVLMAPVTVLFGAPVSFALLVALNLAATAGGWYLVLARCLGLNRGAAILGGLVAGFGPGMMSQSNSHLHITAQWLVPLIVYLVIRLTRVTTKPSAVRTGVALGLVLAAQLLLGEEVLFLAALTIGIFTLCYALRRRAQTRQVLPLFALGLAVAAFVSLALTAYPIWTQLAGDQHTPNAPFGAEWYYTDIATYWKFSPLSLAGPADPGPLWPTFATSSAELNSFLGLPLLVLIIALVVWYRRSPVITSAGITALVMALLSFGPKPTLGGEPLGIPGLYSLIGRIPLVDGALPTRYSLPILALAGVVLAYAIDLAMRGNGIARWVVPIAAVAAVVPILPQPMLTANRPPVPTFITSGKWRDCTPEGGVLVPVPLPSPANPDTMRWAAAANGAFALPEGFFIGPYAAGGMSSVGGPRTGTSMLLADVAQTGQAPEVDEGLKEQARNDLAHYRADCVVLGPTLNEPALRTTLERLLGPATMIEDAWVWKVRR